MKKSRLLAKAITIAAEEFENVYDKGGRPYILHCLWVMNKVRHLGDDYMIVAVLHDLIEDTDWTYQMLLDRGFPLDLIESLELLDFRDRNYFMQIEDVVKDPIAREVKMRDIEHNSKVTRLKGLREKDFERLEKYSKAYTILKNSKDE